MRFILAVSTDNKIAVGGSLPWKISHDLRWFKMNTYGCPIIMGRKTWDSIGRKPLPGRTNIVVSRHNVPGVKCYRYLAALRIYIQKNPKAWVIGGATLCQQLWKSGDILVMTRVHRTVGDHGLEIKLPNMRTLWSKSFKDYTFSINKIV